MKMRRKEQTMLAKKRRTLEVYKTAGAKMRLFKTLAAKLLTDVSCVLPTTDQDKLMRAMDKISEVCSHAENYMFNDLPELPAEYVDVFYGAVNLDPRNELDAEMIQRARQAAHDLFRA